MSVLPGQLTQDLETGASTPPPKREEDAVPRTSRRTSPGGEHKDGAPPGRELVSVSEVSRITGLSANAIYRAIWSGRAARLEAPRKAPRPESRRPGVGRRRPRRARAEKQPPPRRAQRRRPVSSPGRGLRELLQTGAPPR